MKAILLIFAFIIVGRAECMMPELCIESNEGEFLRKYHEVAKEGRYYDEHRFLPKTEEELEYLYRLYKKSEYKDVFFSKTVANIESEIEARCKDGNIELINKYLRYMQTSFKLFLEFEDSNFSDSFFYYLEDNFFNFLLEIEDTVADTSNDFTRDSLHIVYVVSEISKMLERVPCLSDKEPLFSAYDRLCLDDEYKLSDEYKMARAMVIEALSEGVTFSD